MYISSINPGQSFAMGQNPQSGFTAFPISSRSTAQGNCVTYSFNPMMSNAMMSQASGWNMLNPTWMPHSWSQSLIPGTGMSTFTHPALWGTMAYNPYLTQQQFLTSPVINNQMTGQISPMGMGISTSTSTIQSSQGMSQMRLDLHETNSDVIVAAELPNVNLNDLNLTVTDDSLSISATALAGTQTTSLFRTVALPTNVRAEQVEATYSNGILEIRAPKSDISSRRRVKINVAQ